MRLNALGRYVVLTFVVSVLLPFVGSYGVIQAQSCADGGSQTCSPSCQVDNVAVPLTDRAANDYYLGDTSAGGGLYHNGTNTHPELARGIGIANADIYPRDAAGNRDDVNGIIGMFSVGMSNTNAEFSTFVSDYFDQLTGVPQTGLGLNPKLRVVNGAQGGLAALEWAQGNIGEAPWSELSSRLSSRGIDPDQVQVVWIKQAEKNSKPFPDKAHALVENLKLITNKIVAQYPNVKIIFLSSRTRAHRVDSSLSPEPQAYEYGFSLKWLVEQYVNGEYVPSVFGANPPETHDVFLSWGPYLWIDGTNPRSDGRVWPVVRLSSDCIHPSGTNAAGDEAGTRAVSQMLYGFFTTDPMATPWFTDGVGNPPTATPPQASVTPQATATATPGPTATATPPVSVPGDYDDDSDVDALDKDVILSTFETQGLFAYNELAGAFGQ